MSRTSAWNTASLRIEIGIEGAERDARALRNADDRTVGEAALAELVARGIEDLAQSSLATRGSRRLAVASRARSRVCLHALAPIAPPVNRR